MSTNKTESWEEVARKHREEVDARIPRDWLLPASIRDSISMDSDQNVLDIPRTCGILTEKELEITEKYDAVTLLEKLSKAEISAYDVTLAFSKRAAIAQQLTFCLTETMFDAALERAKFLDNYLATEKKTFGPLHGLPISIKDSFQVKDYTTSIGYVSFLQRGKATENAAMVDILLDSGAILHCKTNIPMSMMTADSHNNIYGRTLNPRKLCLTAGGSSGGEGVCVAMRGSLIGVGTDIAGSVRIPAFANGTFGFKPTSHRIPSGGMASAARPGIVGIASTVGPLAHSVRDIEYFMKVCTTYDAWKLDENAISKPWQPVKEVKRLRIGTIQEDPTAPLLPPALRAWKEACKKLEAAGHTLVPIEEHVPSLMTSARNAWGFFVMDPSKHGLSHLAATGEPPIPSMSNFTLHTEGVTADLDTLYKLNAERRATAAQFRKTIVSLKLDCLFTPVFPGTAPKHDSFPIPMFTVLMNLLDYPTCAIPFGTADAKLDAEFVRDVKYEPEYKPEYYEGAPCSFQVAGTYLKDEECLRDTQTVVDALFA